MANIPFLNNAYFSAKVGIGTVTNAAEETNNGIPRLQVTTATAVLGEFPLAARFTTASDAGDNSGVSVLINSGNDRGLMISAGRAVGNRVRATLNLVQYDGNELVDGITLYQPNAASGGATTGTNVGIGTESPQASLQIGGNVGTSSEKLDVRGNSSGNYVASFEQDNATGYGLLIDTDGTLVSQPVLKIKNSSSELFYVGSNGNVGIGTTSPSQKLEVSTDNYNVSKFVGNTDDGTGYVGAIVEIESNNDSRGRGVYLTHRFATDTSDSEWYAGVPYTGGGYSIGNAAYGTSINSDTGPAHKDQSKLFITEAGNVGIGTTSPSKKLEITGSTPTAGDTTLHLKVPTGNITAGVTEMGNILFSSSDASGGGTGSIAKISTIAGAGTSAWIGSGRPTDLAFFTQPLGTSATLVEAMRIDQDGNVGIGITTPTSKLHINQSVTNPNLDQPASFAVEIDSNHSGSAATTGDREQGGLYIDVDSSTTGGDTANEHRLYGIYNNVNHSGDADLVYASSNRVEQNTTTGTTTNVIAGYSAAISDGGSGAVLTNITGVYGSANMQDATPVGNSYAGQFLNDTNANRTGLTSNSYGIKTEIQIGSTSAFTNLYAGRFSIDSNAAYTATNSYLLYLDYAGASLATNTYAIYSPDDVKSYHEGDFGIGTDDPGAKLNVANGNAAGDAALDFPVIRLTNTTGSSDWDVGDKVGVIEYFTTDLSGNAPYVTSFINSVNETINGTLPSGALVFGTANNNAATGANEKIRLSEEGSLIFRNFVTSLATPTTGYLKEMFIANVDGVGTFASNGASNGTYGSFKFITRKGDSSDPIVTMTLDNSHQVGIGIQSPNAKLQVAGGIQMADDTDNAGAAKAGTMRYRTGTEYVEVTGTELISSIMVNTSYSTFDGASSSGFHAINSANSDQRAGTADEIGFVANKTYRVNVDVAVASGNAPFFRAREAIATSPTIHSVQLVDGSNIFTFTSTITITGLLEFSNSSNAEYTVSNVSLMEVTEEDASYADMCMQTGASTYEWVNIVRNTY